MPEPYTTQIADAYMEATGKIHTSPMDWQIISDFEKAKIPLFIPLLVIEEVAARKKKAKIRGMGYFKEEVEARYDEWSTGQQGRNWDDSKWDGFNWT